MCPFEEAVPVIAVPNYGSRFEFAIRIFQARIYVSYSIEHSAKN